MDGICKSFFGVRVLDNVSIDLYGGEVLALVGENGAGKSTLIKILNGDYQKDEGAIRIEGQPVEVSTPRAAADLGIRMIYQELHHCHELTVTENLLLGNLPRRKGALGRGFIDWPAAYQQAAADLALLNVETDPKARMGGLPVVEREIVEIVKAVSTRARIVVMDEPTAALAPKEVDMLFGIVRQLREQGVGIIYISHRLDEIFQIADRVTVLRDGKKVDTKPVSEITKADLVRMMVGHEVQERRSEGSAAAADRPVVLEIRDLTYRGSFEGINITVRAGEIVGIFGLLGAGHAALTRVVFGAERADAGEIWVNGKQVAVRSPSDAQAAGIGFVPIDRKVQGLILGRSLRENLTLSNWRAINKLGFFRQSDERKRAQRWIDDLGIRVAGGMEVETRFMSGGNQQKVVLGRWLEANAKALVLNEPTWGVDVGARADIYDQLETLAKQGLAILMVSSDMQEVLSVSTRILTMYKGKITGEFDAATATQAQLLAAAAGGDQ
jgi:ribose transport system ATP-binding protein